MKYDPLDPTIFIQNRKRFVSQMQKNSIAVFVSNDEFPSNGDALHGFVQNSDLFWLTGIEQEGTMVVLFPDNPDPKYREVLVLVRPQELKEIWDGKRLRAHEATAISGMKTIVWVDSIDAMLQTWIHLADAIYLDSNENDRKNNLVRTNEYRFIDEMQSRYPLHQYLRAAKIMKALRAIKTKQEVVVIQKAIDITESAFRRLLQFIRPGVHEYEIEAEIYHEFLSKKATGVAYHSIIASGDNARTLHYTSRQKEVYNACLHLHDYAKSILKPGISILNYTDKVGEEATKQFLKIGLISKADIKNEDADNKAYRKYLYHGISHHLGIDVHDLGTRTTPIQAGMVFTVEPGIYIKEEGMGVRIENNVWITAKGNQDLFKNIPIKAEEIEALMKRKK
jgi:Xaa-Pro aminopeptidase